MAIGDAACLGKAIADHPGDVDAALQHYDKARVPATTSAVSSTCFSGTCLFCMALYVCPDSCGCVTCCSYLTDKQLNVPCKMALAASRPAIEGTTKICIASKLQAVAC